MSQGLEFEVRDRLSSAQVEDLLRLYGNEWWSAQRTRPGVEQMLAASDLLSAIIEKGSGGQASGVNNTVREVGGVFGVAVPDSVSLLERPDSGDGVEACEPETAA